MSLRMPGPIKHKITGVYYLRQRRPAEFGGKAVAEKVALPVGHDLKFVKVGEWVKVSLGTKNREEATVRYREADTALQQFWQ